MNIFEFMSGSPLLSFFIAVVIGSAIMSSVRYIMMGLSVLKNGYPPAHCDALGGSKTEDDEDND